MKKLWYFILVVIGIVSIGWATFSTQQGQQSAMGKSVKTISDTEGEMNRVASDSTITPPTPQSSSQPSTESASPAVSEPVSGVWNATAVSSFNFNFTVNAKSTGINEIVLKFNDFACGMGSTSGSVKTTFNIDQPVTNGSIRLMVNLTSMAPPAPPNPMNPAPMVPSMSETQRYIITGKFAPDGLSASGKWSATSDGMPCGPVSSGTWTATAPEASTPTADATQPNATGTPDS